MGFYAVSAKTVDLVFEVTCTLIVQCSFTVGFKIVHHTILIYTVVTLQTSVILISNKIAGLVIVYNSFLNNFNLKCQSSLF